MPVNRSIGLVIRDLRSRAEPCGQRDVAQLLAFARLIDDRAALSRLRILHRRLSKRLVPIGPGLLVLQPIDGGTDAVATVTTPDSMCIVQTSRLNRPRNGAGLSWTST
jgi:hypothetical protein